MVGVGAVKNFSENIGIIRFPNLGDNFLAAKIASPAETFLARPSERLTVSGAAFRSHQLPRGGRSAIFPQRE